MCECYKEKPHSDKAVENVVAQFPSADRISKKLESVQLDGSWDVWILHEKALNINRTFNSLKCDFFILDQQHVD